MIELSLLEILRWEEHQCPRKTRIDTPGLGEGLEWDWWEYCGYLRLTLLFMNLSNEKGGNIT
jgi:hypothetical protein